MKHIASIYLLICFFSCKEKELNYYHGVIVDKNLIPILGVTVKTDYADSVYTKTTKNGYFKLPRKANRYGSLVLKKKGYKTDTVRTIWTQSGEFIDYSFINNKIDTVLLIKTTAYNN